MAPSVPGSGALASSAGPAGRGCAVDPGGPVGICDPDGSGGIVGSSGGLLENTGGSVVGVGDGPGAVGLLDGAGGEAAGPGVAAPDGLAGPSSAAAPGTGIARIAAAATSDTIILPARRCTQAVCAVRSLCTILPSSEFTPWSLARVAGWPA